MSQGVLNHGGNVVCALCFVSFQSYMVECPIQTFLVESGESSGLALSSC